VAASHHHQACHDASSKINIVWHLALRLFCRTHIAHSLSRASFAITASRAPRYRLASLPLLIARVPRGFALIARIASRTRHHRASHRILRAVASSHSRSSRTRAHALAARTPHLCLARKRIALIAIRST